MSCGTEICFAEPRYWVRRVRNLMGTVRISPSVNRGLPVDVRTNSVTLALDPPLSLASQPRTQLIASFVAAQVSILANPAGRFGGAANTALGCYDFSTPVSLSNGVVIGPTTTINQLFAETYSSFLRNQSEDTNRLLSIYLHLQARCSL